MVSILLLLLLLSLLLHREARFRVGRNGRHTCFVIQASSSGCLRRVSIGNAITAAGLPGLLLLLLLLDRLQGVAFVDSGHPVAAFVEHLSHLASSEGRRQVTTTSTTGAGRCAGVRTDGRGTDGATAANGTTSAIQVMCGGVGGDGGRGFRGGNHFHFALVPLLLLALLEAHLDESKWKKEMEALLVVTIAESKEI